MKLLEVAASSAGYRILEPDSYFDGSSRGETWLERELNGGYGRRDGDLWRCGNSIAVSERALEVLRPAFDGCELLPARYRAVRIWVVNPVGPVDCRDSENSGRYRLDLIPDARQLFFGRAGRLLTPDRDRSTDLVRLVFDNRLTGIAFRVIWSEEYERAPLGKLPPGAPAFEVAGDEPSTSADVAGPPHHRLLEAMWEIIDSYRSGEAVSDLRSVRDGVDLDLARRLAAETAYAVVFDVCALLDRGGDEAGTAWSVTVAGDGHPPSAVTNLHEELQSLDPSGDEARDLS